MKPWYFFFKTLLFSNLEIAALKAKIVSLEAELTAVSTNLGESNEKLAIASKLADERALNITALKVFTNVVALLIA